MSAMIEAISAPPDPASASLPAAGWLFLTR